MPCRRLGRCLNITKANGCAKTHYINDDESCIEIGSAIAGEAASVDTSKAFKISKTTLDRLVSYFVEVGLMNALGADRAFTEAAQRVARRLSIAGRGRLSFQVTNGKITLTSPATARSDMDDEIPF